MPEDIQRNEAFLYKARDKKLWLWHIPYGVTENDVKKLLLDAGIDEEDIKIEALTIDEVFAGYAIDIPNVRELSTEQEKFWPPGWLVKTLKSTKHIENESLIRKFGFSLAPTSVRITVHQNSKLTPDDIQEFVENEVQQF